VAAFTLLDQFCKPRSDVFFEPLSSVGGGRFSTAATFSLVWSHVRENRMPGLRFNDGEKVTGAWLRRAV